jgi:hypothetical protein
MILKGSVRGSAKALALHLTNTTDNDYVEIGKVSGFMSDDVQDALQEVYALSKGTRCTKFLFSLSLSPPANVDAPDAYFEDAVSQIEQEFNLEGQPKVLIYHIKESRRHAHCVFSRIHKDELKAIKLPYFKQRLNEIAKSLYLQHGWEKEMPDGFKDKQNRDPRNFTLADWQQSKRVKQNPKQIKSRLQGCWKSSDNKKSFTSALTEQGYFLAKGDKRGFVAIDWDGEVYSLSKILAVKSKQLTERLGDSKSLVSVETTKAIIANAQTDIHIRLRQELTLRQQTEAKPLLARKAEVITTQRLERKAQADQHQQRQLHERQQRQAQYQKGLHGLWQLVTGRYFSKKKRHEAEYQAGLVRDLTEKQALIKQHLAAQQTLQTHVDILRQTHQREVMALNADFVKSVKGEALKEALKKDFKQSVAINNTSAEHEVFGLTELAHKLSKHTRSQPNNRQEPEL